MMGLQERQMTARQLQTFPSYFYLFYNESKSLSSSFLQESVKHDKIEQKQTETCVQIFGMNMQLTGPKWAVIS